MLDDPLPYIHFSCIDGVIYLVNMGGVVFVLTGQSNL